MPAAAAAYNVGGMAAFWTATVLRQQPKLERSPLICDKEWEELYKEADAVLKTSSQLFDFSIRHSVITNTLRSTYSDQTESVSIDKLSYAGQRDPHCSSDIQWTSTDAILGEELMEMLNDSKQSVFQLKVSLYLEHLCLDILYNICYTYTLLAQVILNVHVCIRR